MEIRIFSQHEYIYPKKSFYGFNISDEDRFGRCSVLRCRCARRNAIRDVARETPDRQAGQIPLAAGPEKVRRA